MIAVKISGFKISQLSSLLFVTDKNSVARKTLSTPLILNIKLAKFEEVAETLSLN